MNSLFKVGDTVKSEMSGIDFKIDAYLGAGGQGEVYRVSAAGKPMALKWYFEPWATDTQRKILKDLVKRGAPDSRFLWPEDLAIATNQRGFGYLMALRPDRYRSLVHLMTRQVEPSFRSLATASYRLAHSFFQLHASGLCYRDISFGNVFFDPDTGEILVCDNDNVTTNGSQETTIWGTPRFMAPELVRGDDSAWPNTDTDLFSLAVLLFYMLMMHHPLEGEKENQIHYFDFAAMRTLYGVEPVFIFDPNDDSNRPVVGQHDNALDFWKLYPQFLRDRFTEAFTAGIADPQNGRVRETVWRADMVRLRDAIFYCGHCGAENFYDADALKSSGAAGHCWSCRRSLILPPRLRINRQVILLNHDTKLYPHHLGVAQWDFTTPLAEVTQHPQDPSIWGLKNLSAAKWSAVSASGDLQEIAPGRSVRLAVGTRIQFGAAEGEIRV